MSPSKPWAPAKKRADITSCPYRITVLTPITNSVGILFQSQLYFRENKVRVG